MYFCPMIVIFFTKKFSCRWILFLYKERNNFWNFFPIDIFEKDYIGMQFETLHSWFTSSNEIINEENRKEKYEISMKICDLFLKKMNIQWNTILKLLLIDSNKKIKIISI